MADTQWMENIKKIVLQAVEAGDPCDIIPGLVTGTAPLSVQIDQKTILNSRQLLIPQSLTDHNVEMEIPGQGAVTANVKNALKQGERVLLIQKRGGQQYLVMDRW